MSHKDCLSAIVPNFNYENPFMRAEGSTPPSVEMVKGKSISNPTESDVG